jgi:uncharacterized protein (TIGR03067 family)
MTASVLFAALTLAAPALKERPAKGDGLVGEWVIESSVYNGRPRRQPAGEPTHYQFAADGTWTTTRGERKTGGIRAYRVDRDADPPAITLKYEPAEQDGREALGIYKVEGDRLTLCYSRAGHTARPTALESTEGSGLNLVILKRVKPKD